MGWERRLLKGKTFIGHPVVAAARAQRSEWTQSIALIRHGVESSVRQLRTRVEVREAQAEVAVLRILSVATRLSHYSQKSSRAFWTMPGHALPCIDKSTEHRFNSRV